jgi:hypothetical protein
VTRFMGEKSSFPTQTPANPSPQFLAQAKVVQKSALQNQIELGLTLGAAASSQKDDFMLWKAGQPSR